MARSRCAWIQRAGWHGVVALATAFAVAPLALITPAASAQALPALTTTAPHGAEGPDQALGWMRGAPMDGPLGAAMTAPGGAVQLETFASPDDVESRLRTQGVIPRAGEVDPRPREPEVPEAPIARRSSTSPPTSASSLQTVQPNDTARAATDLSLFRNTSLTSAVPGLYRSSVDEPSVTNVGNTVFYTGNWYAAVSADAGVTFRFVSPFLSFPPTGGGFCCDQQTIAVSSTGLAVWLLQYAEDLSGNNVERIAVSAGATNLAQQRWHYWDFSPQQMGFAGGCEFDFPMASYSTSYLYFTANVFCDSVNSGQPTVVRVPLADLQAGVSSVSYTYFKPGISGTTAPVVCPGGCSGTMYFAQHLTTGALRLRRWVEADNSTAYLDVLHSTYLSLNTIPGACPAPNGLDICTSPDSRLFSGWLAGGIMGFAWMARQGEAGLGTFPFPYIHVVRINTSTWTLQDEPIIFNNGFAWVFPGIAANGRGDIAAAATTAGGGRFPGTAVLVRDDISAGEWSILAVASGEAAPGDQRWGDFLTVRADNGSGNTWVAGTYVMNGACASGGESCAGADPRFVWFGRLRDNPFATPCTGATLGAGQASPQVAGTAITLTGSAGGCTSAEYKYWVQPPGGGWTQLRDWGSGTYTWDTTGLSGGAYTLNVWVRQSGSSAAFEAYGLLAYTLTGAASCTNATLTPSPTSPQASGTSVVLSASASGCSAPEYKFWVEPSAGGWTQLRDWGSSTYTWNTSGLTAGNYRVAVWVRQQGSSATYETYSLAQYTLTTTACTGASLTPSPASPQAAGTSISLTASTNGCNAPEYKFWIYMPGGEYWWLLRDWGSGTYAWDTTGLAAGTYQFNVWVRQQGSLATYQTYALASYSLFSTACRGATLTPSATSPPAGATITLTASATNCSTPEYRFWAQPPGGGSYTLLRDWGSSTYAWNTSGLAGGTYTLNVWVRQTGSSVTLDTYALASVTLAGSSACSGVTLAASPPSPQAAGVTTTLTGTASGCTAPEYKYWVQPPGGSWTQLRDWGSGTYPWNTTGLAAGTYQLAVWSRQRGTSASFETYQIVPFVLSPSSGGTGGSGSSACTGVTLNPSPTSPRAVGTSIMLAGSASGCSSAEYKYWVQAPGGSWTQVRDWGSGSYTWSTTGLAAGTYQLNVWVRRSGSNATYDAYTVASYTLTS